MTTTLDISTLEQLTQTTTTNSAAAAQCEINHTCSGAYQFQEKGPQAFASPVLLDQESL